MPKFVDDWRDAWWVQDFRKQFFLSTATLAAAVFLMRLVMGLVETRAGVPIRDPLLVLFSPIDLNLITYTFIYSSILLGLFSLSLNPFALLLATRALILVILFRIICLYLLPLEPPSDIVPLSDPLMHWAGLREVFTRDLFFSWHTSVVALFTFTARWKDIKIILACLTFVVSALTLLHHADYTIDVVAAVGFTYVAYSIAMESTVDETAALPRSIRSEKV